MLHHAENFDSYVFRKQIIFHLNSKRWQSIEINLFVLICYCVIHTNLLRNWIIQVSRVFVMDDLTQRLLLCNYARSSRRIYKSKSDLISNEFLCLFGGRNQDVVPSFKSDLFKLLSIVLSTGEKTTETFQNS